MKNEDEELLKIAEDRIKNTDMKETISQEYIIKKYDISENEIDKLMEYVEIE